MPSSKSQQTVSPSRPLTVQIPTGLDAAMSASGANGPQSRESATEADIKFGERTAFIPMTCQEQQVLDRLEAGLQAAAGLWQDFQQQQEHDKLMSSAQHHWRAATGAGIDTSWVWEVGRWNTQFSLPFALELRRLDPNAMADGDHLLALSTCLRNRQIELAKKLSAAAATATGNSYGGGGGGGGSGGGSSGGSGGGRKKAAATPPGSLDELEDEPCLCQIRWGLAPDTEAAKRRQLEKLDEDHPAPQPQPKKQQLTQQPHHHHHHHQGQPPHPVNPPSAGHRRPIVKTSHLRGQVVPPEPTSAFSEDAGYASQNCSPGSRGGFINDLLAVSACGGRSWAD